MIYNSDGSINVTVVSGNEYTGLYAADGSWNVVISDGTLGGVYHPCGAYRVTINDSAKTRYADDGSLNVTVIGLGAAPLFVNGLSQAAILLAGEEGLAIDFTDTALHSSTGHYGTAIVNDTSTVNSFSGVPVDLLTYSSPSLKLTRGPNGDLRYAAHNLFLHSEDLTDSDWVAQQSTISSGKLAPDGSSTAFSLSETSTDGSKTVGQSVSFLAGIKYTFTYRFKAGARNYAQIWGTSTIFGSNVYANFDLENGVLGTVGSAATASITPLGDGWYLCSITGTANSTASGNVAFNSIRSATAARNEVWSTPNLDDAIYVWRPHVRRAASEDTYLATTDAIVIGLPFEWDEDGESLGIKLEPEGTNLFLNNRAPATQDITVTAQSYTLSFYGTGSITLSGAHSTTLNGTGENERVSKTFTPSAGTLTCTVSGTVDFVQVETGTLATSPIETAGSSVTRARDNLKLDLSKTPWSDTVGTIYVKAQSITTSSGDEQVVQLQYEDPPGSTSNRHFCGYDRYFVETNGSTQANMVSGAPIFLDSHKMAWAFQSNDFVYAWGGTVIDTDTSGTPPHVEEVCFGANRTTTRPQYIQEFMLIPRRMTDSELENLTHPTGELIQVGGSVALSVMRDHIIQQIWSGNGIPTTGVDSIETDIENPLTTNSPSNLLQVDQYTINMDDNAGSTLKTTQPYIFRPTSETSNNALILFGIGHSNNVNSSVRYDLFIKDAVEDGYTVATIFGPSGSAAGHNAFPAPTATLNYLKFFAEPAIRVMNELETEFPTIFMAGLSGGGWLTDVVAAIDTRIIACAAVAGSFPLYIPVTAAPGGGERDWEQFLPGLREDLNLYPDYTDLHVMAAHDGREKIQILNDLDDCCFRGDDYEKFRPYHTEVAARALSLGGTWSMEIVESTVHTITTAARSMILDMFTQRI